MQEKVIIRLTFYPGLALTVLRKMRPCFQQVKPGMSPRSNREPVLGQLQERAASMSYRG